MIFLEDMYTLLEKMYIDVKLCVRNVHINRKGEARQSIDIYHQNGTAVARTNGEWLSIYDMSSAESKLVYITSNFNQDMEELHAI